MATLEQNINQVISDFANIKSAIIEKGVGVPTGTPTSAYGNKILEIQSGTDTSGDTVIPAAMREGFTAHNASGAAITGTIPNYDGSIAEGAVEGAQAKYNEGVEAGKKSQYDAFWDSFQGRGARKNYSYAFASSGWTGSIFNPKYDIIPSTVRGFFWNGGLNGVDVAQKLSSLGVQFDTSGVKDYDGFNQFCYYGSPSRLPVISTVGCETLANFLVYATVVTIDKLVLKEDGTQTFSSSFLGCTNLKNLTIEGTIGKNGFNTSWSPLNKASLTSVVNALSSTTTGLTVTLRLDAVNTAFETSAGAADGSTSEEWLVLAATKPNWNISLINP